MSIPRNIGSTDRVIRTVIGIAMITLAVFSTGSGAVATLVGFVGVVLVVSAALRYCPLYTLLGVTTYGPTPHGH